MLNIYKLGKITKSNLRFVFDLAGLESPILNFFFNFRTFGN